MESADNLFWDRIESRLARALDIAFQRPYNHPFKDQSGDFWAANICHNAKRVDCDMFMYLPEVNSPLWPEHIRKKFQKEV